MKKILVAIALTIALPAMAQAQVATAAPGPDCCEKMKDMACCKHGTTDCKDMAKMDHGGHGMDAGAGVHAGHAMSAPAAKAPPAAATHDDHN